MAYKLKNLQITSTDLVDQGANPEAQIGLFKGKGFFSGGKSERKREVLTQQPEKKFSTGSRENFEDVLKKEMEVGTMIEEIVPEGNDFFSMEKHGDVLKSYESKIAQLEKSLALVEMEKVANGYEALGYEPKSLAKKLYSMKESGVYEEYIAVLDLGLTLVGKSSLFQEIGRCAVYTEQGVEDLMKREGCSREAAFMKAYEENPAFARAYEQEYNH